MKRANKTIMKCYHQELATVDEHTPTCLPSLSPSLLILYICCINCFILIIHVSFKFPAMLAILNHTARHAPRRSFRSSQVWSQPPPPTAKMHRETSRFGAKSQDSESVAGGPTQHGWHPLQSPLWNIQSSPEIDGGSTEDRPGLPLRGLLFKDTLAGLGTFKISHQQQCCINPGETEAGTVG